MMSSIKVKKVEAVDEIEIFFIGFFLWKSLTIIVSLDESWGTNLEFFLLC